MADTTQQVPPWRGPTNWTGSTPFPDSPPTPPSGKLGYEDWWNQNGKDRAYSASFGSPGASYLDYLKSSATAPAIQNADPGQAQPTIPSPVAIPPAITAQNPLTPPSTTLGTQSQSTNQYAPLTPYTNNSYGVQAQASPPSSPLLGTLNKPRKFYGLPSYGFYQ